MNIYVGNLSWGTTESDLRAVFEDFGQVDSVSIIKDRDTGRSRGFGFVEMSNDSEAQMAIESLNGADLDGRSLKVNVARPREERGGGNRSRYGNRSRDRGGSRW